MMSLFCDDAGNLSSTRVLTAAIVAVVLFNWTYATVRSGSWQPLDLDAALAYAARHRGYLGTLLGEAGHAASAPSSSSSGTA